MQRNGVCLDALRAEAVEALPVVMRKQRGREWDENASLRDMLIRSNPDFKVRWEPTQHGYRPRYVEVFEFRGSYPHTLIHTVELPNWSAAWEEAIDISVSVFD